MLKRAGGIDMETKLDRAKSKLIKMLDEANWRKIELTMKPSGDKIEITPCGYGEINEKNVEYFLCYSPKLPWMGADNIDYLVKELLSYEDDVKEHDRNLIELAEYRKKMLNSNSAEEFEERYSSYSDWHKDLYGYRPRGDQQIIDACKKWRGMENW